MLKVKRVSKGGLKIPVMPNPMAEDSLATIPFHFISNPSDFQSLLLPGVKSATELAVDLEHHHLHSYLGKTCLMQISTREADFVVDTLALRSQVASLASIFENPQVVKVLHGADSDVLWLQRDFGIFIVNLFDTGRASRLLQFPSHSYAYLLQHFCKMKTDKSFQLADWRQRPLSDEMIKYARMDTHYLLHIYDCLKVELERKGQQNSKQIGDMLLHAWQQSAHVALRVYTKPKLKDDQYQSLLERNRCLLSSKMFKVLKLLLKWRDWVARRLDLNPHTLLKNSSLFRIVKQANSTYADLQHLLQESSPLLGAQTKQYALDLFQRLQAKLRGKKPKESQLVTDPEFPSPALKPAKPDPDIMREIGSTRASTYSSRGSLLGTVIPAQKSGVVSFLIKRMKKGSKREMASKFAEKLDLQSLIGEQMKKLKRGLEEKRMAESMRREKEGMRQEGEYEAKQQIEDTELLEKNPVEGDVITFSSELPKPLVVVEPRKGKKQKKRKEGFIREEPEVMKKMVEEEDGEMKEKAKKMLEGSYKSLDQLRGTEKLKRNIKQQQKQISRKQKELSRRAPPLFGSKH